MASPQATMNLMIHNASDKKVTVAVDRCDPTGNLIGTSPVEVNPRQTASFSPGAAATIEARVPPTVFMSAYASGSNDLLACTK
jgi:hypothetical protein